MHRKILVVVGAILLSLVSCCGLLMVAGFSADESGELDGRYECMVAATVMNNGLLWPQYQPAGLWFEITGDGYTTGGSEGSVSFDAQTVTFSGGGYDGWRAARLEQVIVFRKDHGDPLPGEAVRFGDFRCAKVQR